MADYISSLTGVAMDQALLDMAEHTSEAYAVGERNGVPVDSSDVTYHNNARYYAQQAQSIAPASVTEAVRWDVAQTALTDANRALARENINATPYNYNLLDNSWFLVNSRNVTTVSTNYTYGADRWQLNTGSVTFAVGSMTLAASSNVGQRIDIPSGTYTASVKLSDGTIISGSGTVGNTTTTFISNSTVELDYFGTQSPRNFRIYNTSGSAITIVAAKIELGSFSTLAYDTPPDYGEELVRCIYSRADPSDTYANQPYPAFSNENLLDNCYFVGGGSQLGYGKFPINQNGQTSYTGSGRMIDRWFGQNNAGGMTLTADGLVFTNSASGYGYIRHTLTRATQRTGWTLSVLTADGTVYKSSDSTGITLPSGLLLYWASSNALTFRVPANLEASETIVSIKYEAFPYSTILNDIKPDFDRELQKAQAHYIKLVDIALPAIANASGVSLTPFIPTATTMSPTSTVQTISIGWVRKAGYQAYPSVSASNVNTKIFPGFVFLQITHGLNNITAQDTYWINFSNLQIGDGI